MVDGFFIRSLLMAFFFKLFPKIVEDGRLYIAEPPLYRVDDKKNPFVINKLDYIDRYVKSASKDYKLGYINKPGDPIEYLDKTQWTKLLTQTASYVDDMMMLVEHYKVNARLLEMIYEEFALMKFDLERMSINDMISKISIQHLIDRIGTEFKEIGYDDKRGFIIGVIDARQQLVEIDEALIRKGLNIIAILQEWMPTEKGELVLKDNKTGASHNLSLLGVLKILKKYQPDILHRFKGLGENDQEDIWTTIMNPDSRMLIRVNIGDMQNDMQVMQMLRGHTTQDLLARRALMKSFKIDKSEIDT